MFRTCCDTGKCYVFTLFQVGLSLDETVEQRDLRDLLEVFGCPHSLVIPLLYLYLDFKVDCLFVVILVYLRLVVKQLITT